MKITIESTDIITELNGVPCRVWRGVTDAGTPCDVFVHRIGAHGKESQAPLERELREMAAPREMPLQQAIDLRHII